MFFQALIRALFGDGSKHNVKNDTGYEPDDEELAEAAAQAEDLLSQNGILSSAEELEIEDIIKELRNSGCTAEAKRLQEQYDEYYSWNYDNEDDF